MQERRALALVALILGIVAGVLFLVEALNVGRNPNIDVQFILDRLLTFGVAILVILGGVVIWRGQTVVGGLLNLILGVIALLLVLGLAGSVLALISGVIGLVAGPARPR